MNIHIINRLEFLETVSEGEHEQWVDPQNGNIYEIPIVIERYWDDGVIVGKTTFNLSKNS